MLHDNFLLLSIQSFVISCKVFLLDGNYGIYSDSVLDGNYGIYSDSVLRKYFPKLTQNLVK